MAFVLDDLFYKWVAGRAFEGFFGYIKGEQLDTDLKNTIGEWFRELPEQLRVAGHALNPTKLNEDTGPAIAALNQRIEKKQPPTRAQWLAALMELWSRAQQHTQAAFFQQDKNKAEKQLTDLAARLHLVCHHDKIIFRTGVVDKLEKITEVITPSLNLTLHQHNSPNKETLSKLHYMYRQSKLIGRQIELQQLREFYEDKTKHFSWWVWTGFGGVGKSRLLLDSALSLSSDWERGFLKSHQLQTLDFNQWRPTKKTLILIDYAATYTDKTCQLLDALIDNHHRNLYEHPVRVLLIERQTENQKWWQTLLPGAMTSVDQSRRQYLYNEPYVLKPLKKNQQRELLPEFLRVLDSQKEVKLPAENDSDFWEKIGQLTDEGRPLFIAIVAAAITEHGIASIRQWHTEQLLQELLEREKAAWRRITGFKEREKDCDTLIALGTLCQGLDIDHNADAINQIINAYQLIGSDLETLAEPLQRVVSEYKYFALEPDIFGECFLLQTLKKQKPKLGKDPNRHITRLLQAAWSINPFANAEVIYRTIKDFPHNNEPLWWIECLQTTNSDSMANSWLISHYLANIATVYWDNHEHEKHHNALNRLQQIGDQHPYHAKIQLARAVGLMNTTCNYGDANDLKTSVNYLQQLQALAERFPTHAEIQLHLAMGLYNATAFYGDANDLKTGGDYLQQLQALAERFPTHTEIQLHLTMGLCNATAFYGDANDLKTSGDYLQQLQALAERFPTHAEIQLHLSKGLCNAAILYCHANDLKTSVNYLQQLQALAERFPTYAEIQLHLSKGLYSAAAFYRNASDLKTGRDYLQQLQALAERFPTHTEIQLHLAMGLCSAAAFYCNANDLKTGRDYLQQLQALAERFPTHTEIQLHLAMGLCNVVVLYYHANDLKTSVNYLQQLQTLVGRFPKHAEIQLALAKGLCSVAILYYHANDLKSGGDYLQQLQALAERFPTHTEIQLHLAMGLCNAAILYCHANDLKTSVNYLQQLQALAERFPRHAEIQLALAKGLYSAAILYYHANDLKTGGDYLQQLSRHAKTYADNEAILLLVDQLTDMLKSIESGAVEEQET